MTFNSRETSAQNARPIELYHIVVSGTDYYFTNSELDQVYLTKEYLPASITRTQPRVSQDEPGSEVELTFATNEPVAQALTRAWVTSAPETRTSTVTIYKHHVDDTDFQTFWVGSIVSVSYREQGHITVFLCRSLDNLFTLQGPRRNWGTLCTHQHYDRFCTLNNVTYTQSGIVTAIDSTGVVYTIPGISAPTVRWAAGELAKPLTALSRMIIAQSGDDFTLQYPIPEIAVGDTVEVIEGCLHDVADCKGFSNLLNFGGIPYTPDINPFTATRGLEDL